MRYLLAGVLVVLAVVAGYFALGVLSNLWADYQDSSTSTYLMFGLPFLAISLGALAGAAFALRRD